VIDKKKIKKKKKKKKIDTFRGGLVPSDLGVGLQPHEPEALCLWNDTTLPATGFLGFLDPQKHSAATGPYYEYNGRGYAVLPGVDIRCHAC